MVSVQLVRLGVGRIIIIDLDVVEQSNLNRLVASTLKDAKNNTPKVEMHPLLSDLDFGILPAAEKLPVRHNALMPLICPCQSSKAFLEFSCNIDPWDVKLEEICQNEFFFWI